MIPCLTHVIWVLAAPLCRTEQVLNSEAVQPDLSVAQGNPRQPNNSLVGHPRWGEEADGEGGWW